MALDYTAGAIYAKKKMQEAARSAKKKAAIARKRTVAGLKKDFGKKNITPSTKSLEASRKMILKSTQVSPELKAQRANQMAALRARKQQLNRVTQLSDKANIAQGIYPNKFARMEKAREMRLNEMDASRRFHAPKKDHAAIMNALHQRERERRQADEREFSLLKAHENMVKVPMDTLSTEGSILMTENIFRSDNPNNRDIMRTGRPGVLDVPESEQLMKTKMRLKFF